MLRRILVPLDGSECAVHAFDYALGLAKGEGAKIDVCSIVDPVAIVGRNLPSPLEEERVAAAKRQADQIVEAAAAKARAAGLTAVEHVGIGEPAAAIVARAASTNADTIVMGTHGRSGFRRLFMGYVAEEVLRSSPCPVVMVREKASVAGGERLALPAIDRDAPVCMFRLLEVVPQDYDKLYREIAEFLRGPGADLPGLHEARLFGSLDASRIVILTEFDSHRAWVRAQWDARLGKLLEDLAIHAQTLEFNLYHGDRFLGHSKRKASIGLR
jgi:nucleotide-binding universal stress UspA family protein